MIDFEARKIVEALRSGISSRAAGQYFSSARQELLTHISRQMNHVGESKISTGLVISGKYGEGKTHLLNTVFNMAHSNNMVVSLVSLSKETPFDKPYLIYQKLLHNTYLPGRLQSGFLEELMSATPGSPLASDMLAFAAKHLETDKLYYLLRAYLHTDDVEEKFILQSDLEGDFISNAGLKQMYKRLFAEKAVYNTNFSKTRHIDDYFALISRLFLAMGYDGWVILFDEAELIGRLGKKARLNAYKNMARFLFPNECYQAIYSIFTFTSSYMADVIDGKNEFANLNEAGCGPEDYAAIEKTLRALLAAKQLHPLSREEIAVIMDKLIGFYKRAYDWQTDIDIHKIAESTENRGYLLRTRIRACIEYLDQLYQYREISGIRINGLGQVSYGEDIPSLEEIADL